MMNARRVMEKRVPFFVDRIAGASGSLKWGVYERMDLGRQGEEQGEGQGKTQLVASWNKRSEAREAVRQLNKEERESGESAESG
jgi:hypothetical protein